MHSELRGAIKSFSQPVSEGMNSVPSCAWAGSSSCCSPTVVVQTSERKQSPQEEIGRTIPTTVCQEAFFQCAFSTKARCECVAHIVQALTDEDANATVAILLEGLQTEIRSPFRVATGPHRRICGSADRGHDHRSCWRILTTSQWSQTRESAHAHEHTQLKDGGVELWRSCMGVQEFTPGRALATFGSEPLLHPHPKKKGRLGRLFPSSAPKQYRKIRVL